MLNLLWHEISSRRVAILGWGVGLIFFMFMYTLIYPELQGTMADLGDLSVYQAMGVEVATFEGYIASSVIGFIPILLGVYAIMASTKTLAGEEDDGTLELLLTSRLKRWQIVAAKAIALLMITLVVVLIAGAAAMVAFNLIKDQVVTDVTASDMFRVVLSTLPLVWVFIMLGLMLSAWLPGRRLALLVGLMVLIFGYFGENIGNLVDSLEVIKPLSLFSYFDSSSAAFTDGIKWSDVIILLVLADLFFLLALLGFQRRDITVGNWPWQRVRLGNN